MRFSGLAAGIALSIALDRNRVHLGYATQGQSRWGHKVQANQKRMSGVLLTDKVTSFTIFVLIVSDESVGSLAYVKNEFGYSLYFL